MSYDLFTILLSFAFFQIGVHAEISSLESMLSDDNVQEWFRNISKTKDSTNPYCHICCLSITPGKIERTCGTHTMCVYHESERGNACKGYINMEFTQMEKNAIVDAHNTLRNRVAAGQEEQGQPGPQPPAANMRMLEWNDELATIAKRWASQCVFNFDYCRDTKRYPVGQNIARGNLTGSNELIFIKDWYNQLIRFSKEEIQNFKGTDPSISAYTQLVWADTAQVGCARAFFQSRLSSKVTYVEQFFCNYGPTGNIPGQPVYLVGEAGSFCPEGTGKSSKYMSLCGSELDIKINATATNYTSSKPDGFRNVIQILLPVFLVIFK